jgi:hypothetical protein
MFSERALTYLRSLERRDYVKDLAVVRDALISNGVPAEEAFLELHAALAGYAEPAVNDEFVYGIIHLDSYWAGPLSPCAWERDGLWYATYADGHPSYRREIDEKGVMYGDGGKVAASFVTFIEHHAFIAAFWNSGPTVGNLVTVPVSSTGGLKDSLEPLRVQEMSDGIATIWAAPTFCLYATESTDWRLWMRPGSPLGELAPFVRF